MTSVPDDPDDEKVYIDTVESFGIEFQARYLLKLRSGVLPMHAARDVGFTPRSVKSFRKSNPVFNEYCEEAIEEADEEVLSSILAAAKKGQPWASKIISEMKGWNQVGSTGGTTNNFLAIDGNPLERIMKMQTELQNRKPETPVDSRVIDVSGIDN